MDMPSQACIPQNTSNQYTYQSTLVLTCLHQQPKQRYRSKPNLFCTIADILLLHDRATVQARWTRRRHATLYHNTRPQNQNPKHRICSNGSAFSHSIMPISPPLDRGLLTQCGVPQFYMLVNFTFFFVCSLSLQREAMIEEKEKRHAAPLSTLTV